MGISHSKILYARSLWCQPPSSVSRSTIPPTQTVGGPLTAQKLAETHPKSPHFPFLILWVGNIFTRFCYGREAYNPLRASTKEKLFWGVFLPILGCKGVHHSLRRVVWWSWHRGERWTSKRHYIQDFTLGGRDTTNLEHFKRKMGFFRMPFCLFFWLSCLV